MKDLDPIFITFLKKEQITSDAWTFYFSKPTGFAYKAGQYIKIKLPIDKPDNRGVSRYFTLSSSSTEEHLTITTRIIKSTFKKTLSGLVKGDRVEVRGPWGEFVLDEADTRTRVFLAGDIGLTPYYSMIKYVDRMKLDIKIILIVSYKTEQEILFANELNQIAEKNKNIKVVVTISEPGKDWKGESGRINSELLRKMLASLSKNVYYIAGPDPMIASLQKMLKKEGVFEDQILTDGFPGYTS